MNGDGDQRGAISLVSVVDGNNFYANYPLIVTFRTIGQEPNRARSFDDSQAGRSLLITHLHEQFADPEGAIWASWSRSHLAICLAL